MVHAQKDKWALFPNEVDFDAVPTPPGITAIGFTSPDMSLTTPYKRENSVYDENGDLLFYYQDGNIFDADGQLSGGNSYHSSSTSTVSHEVVILPVPGTCSNYCIFTIHSLPLSTFFLVAQEVAVGSGGALTVSTEQVVGTTLSGNTGSIGASKIVGGTEANRVIYVAVNTMGEIHQYFMSSTGTVAGAVLTTFTGSSDYGSELEVSPDGNLIAWSVGQQVYIYSFIAEGRLHNTELDGQVMGLEFSAGSDVLLASVSGVGIVRINMTSPFAEAMISGSANFDNTYLEASKEKRIYAVNDNDDELYAIEPDLMTITPTSTVVFSNLAGFFTLPDQIDGESDDSFYGVTPISLDNLSIDDLDLPVAVGGVIPAFYNCDNIDLVVEYTGTPTSYGIEIYSVNPSTGTKITGIGYLDYADNFSGEPDIPIDLRCIDDAVNCDLFDGFFGQTFAVRVVIRTKCEAVDRIGYFKVYDAPTAASIKLEVLSGDPLDDECPAAHTPTSPCVGGTYSCTVLLSNSSGDFTYFQVSIDETNCSTGAVIQNLYNSPATALNVGSTLSFGVNSFVINGSTGHFANPANGWVGRCIRVTAEVGNNCGSDSDYTYILFSGQYLGGGSEDEKLLARKLADRMQDGQTPFSVFPNPANDVLNIQLPNGASNEVIGIAIMDATGRVLKQVHQEDENGTIPVSISDLPSGAYHYRIRTPQHVTSGTFVKH